MYEQYHATGCTDLMPQDEWGKMESSMYIPTFFRDTWIKQNAGKTPCQHLKDCCGTAAAKGSKCKARLGHGSGVFLAKGKYAELAKHELEGGRYEDAIKSASSCLANQPKNYAVGFLKAIAQDKLGKDKEAIATLENLIGMSGIDPDTKAKFNLSLGLFYKKMGDKTRAAERFKDAYFLSFKYAARGEYEKITGEKE